MMNLYKKISSSIHVDDMPYTMTNDNIQNNPTLEHINNILDKKTRILFNRFVSGEANQVAQLYVSRGYIKNVYVLFFKQIKNKKLYVAYMTEHYMKGYLYIIGGIAITYGGVQIYIHSPVLAKITNEWFFKNKAGIINWIQNAYKIVGGVTLLTTLNKLKQFAFNGFANEEELRGDIYAACLALKLYNSYEILRATNESGIKC